jgi:hypothetical protein
MRYPESTDQCSSIVLVHSMSTLLKPSSLIPKGLRVKQVNNMTLFKFTEELGDRLQTLLDRKKANTLTPEESIEIEAIGELDEIFKLHQRRNCCQIKIKNSLEIGG